VDWELLRKYWKDWMQLVLSVQAGRISSPTLIRQLSHYSQLNPLARFAEELGKAERTMFLLEWISNQLLRQTVTAMTNKVESYHGFSKWLSFDSRSTPDFRKLSIGNGLAFRKKCSDTLSPRCNWR
jgi:TnpA family transposase